MGIALLNWAPRLQDYQAHKYYSYINLCGVVKCDRLSFAFTWPVSLKFYFLAVVKVDAFGNFLDVFHWQSSFSHKQRLGERGRCRPLRSRARAKLPPPLKTHLKPVLHPAGSGPRAASARGQVNMQLDFDFSSIVCWSRDFCDFESMTKSLSPTQHKLYSWCTSRQNRAPIQSVQSACTLYPYFLYLCTMMVPST